MKGLNTLKKLATGAVAMAALYAAPVQAQEADAGVRQAEVEEEEELPAQLPDAQLPDAQLPDAQLPDAQLPDAQLPDAAPIQPNVQPQVREDDGSDLEHKIACLKTLKDKNGNEVSITYQCAKDLIDELETTLTINETTVVNTNNADGYARTRIEENEDRVRGTEKGLSALRAYVDNQLSEGLNNLKLEGQIALYAEVEQIYKAHNGLMGRVKDLEARKLPASLTIVQEGVEGSKTYQALKAAKVNALRAEFKYEQVLLGITNYHVLVKHAVAKATANGAGVTELRALYKRLDLIAERRLNAVDNSRRELHVAVNLTNNLYDSLTGRVTDLADGNYAKKTSLVDLGLTAGIRANEAGAYVALGAKASKNLGNLVLTVFGEGHLGADEVLVGQKKSKSQPCANETSQDCGGYGLTESRKVVSGANIYNMATGQFGASVGADLFNGSFTPSLGLLGILADQEEVTTTQTRSQLSDSKGNKVGPKDATVDVDRKNRFNTDLGVQLELCAKPTNSGISVCGDYTFNAETQKGDFGLKVEYEF